MSAPESSGPALAAFDAVLAALEPRGARRSQMMGRPMLAHGRQMFACLEGDDLGIRLGAGTPEHTAALALPGADVFSPGARGRQFRDWVELPLDQAGRWAELAGVALDRLRGAPGTV